MGGMEAMRRPGFGDAHGVHRVALQQCGDVVFGDTMFAHHGLEEPAHAGRVEACGRQKADADPIGLVFFHAREIDLLLHARGEASDTMPWLHPRCR